MNLLPLYAEFFKIGLFAVGGGLATLPFLFQMADKYDWLNREMVGNFLAIAQSSPGAVGVNMAAETGFQYGGVAGSVCAAFGLISPAIIIVTVIARMLLAFKTNKVVVSVFSGLRPAAAGLLATACLGAWKIALYNSSAVWYAALRWKECILCALIFAGISRFKGHPILYIVIAGAAGIFFKL